MGMSLFAPFFLIYAAILLMISRCHLTHFATCVPTVVGIMDRNKIGKVKLWRSCAYHKRKKIQTNQKGSDGDPFIISEK